MFFIVNISILDAIICEVRFKDTAVKFTRNKT
jgi:hypothetical protein